MPSFGGRRSFPPRFESGLARARQMNRSATRRDKLRRALKKSGARALLVTNFTNVTYLSGFTGDDSYLLVAADSQWLISDSRYATQIQQECPGLDAYIRGAGQSMVDAVLRVIRSTKISPLGIEADSMTVSLKEQLDGRLPKVELVGTTGIVEKLREIKDKDEIAAIRRAVRTAEKAFAVVRVSLRGELTEKQVADELEHQLRLFGAQGASFPPIVAVGARAALPHAVPSAKRIEEAGFVLIDWGACQGQYKSDLTRVLVTDKISTKLERVYRVVLKAQTRAIAAIRPGVSAHKIDAVARETIVKAGFGRNFGHGLGHGVGLEIHERPRLAQNQKTPLAPGMVVTVEPGIYLPGWGGVRIEDDVLVTRSGHEVLSSTPKRLEEVVLD